MHVLFWNIHFFVTGIGSVILRNLPRRSNATQCRI